MHAVKCTTGQGDSSKTMLLLQQLDNLFVRYITDVEYNVLQVRYMWQ